MSGFPYLTPGTEPGHGGVSPAVSPLDPPGVPPWDEAGAVSPGDEDGDGDTLDWISGRWESAEPGDEPTVRGGTSVVSAVRRHLADRAGGLAAELCDPQPETLRQHRDYVAGHPLRPEGKWQGIAFVAVYGAVTFPAKAAGKAMIQSGEVLQRSGLRVDWAGDRLARIGTVILFLAAVIVVIVFFA